MGSGLLILVSGSREKYYLTKKPEITFFKMLYKRHTNFSVETIPQSFTNPLNFGKQSTLKIGKNGDLLTNIYLHLELPTISANNSSLPSYKIRYVNNLGYACIKKIELEIGGVVISSQYGEWLYIWNELTRRTSHNRGLNQVLGNYSDVNTNQTNLNSIKLDIPLTLWFCGNSNNALPLVSLTQEDVKLHIELRSFEEIIIQSPQKYITVDEKFSILEVGEQFTQNVNGKKSAGEFIEFDIVNRRLYYNPLYGEFQVPSSSNTSYKLTGTNGAEHNITVNSSTPSNVTDFFNLNYPSLVDSYCLVDYVFLGNDERYLYLSRNHEYLIENVQNITEETVFSSNVKLNLPVSHPVKGIFWRAILQNNVDIKDYFNYSTYPYTSTRNPLVKNIKIIINGQSISNVETEEYYGLIQKHNYYEGRGNRHLYTYSFSINPLDKSQPYGSINFSKIENAYIQMTLDGIVSYSTPVQLKAYVLSYNVFRIIDGVGNLVFDN